MKRVMILALVLLLSLGVAACSSSSSTDDTGSTTEPAGTTETPSTTTTEPAANLEWPTADLPEHVPELEGVTLTNVISSGDSVSIKFEGCNKDIADAYVQAIEDAGWEILMNKEQAGGFTTVMATNKTETLQFAWRDSAKGDGTMSYIGKTD